MGSGLYKRVNGERVELSSREVKAEIIRINGWSEAQYNANRKQLTKRINTYNAVVRSNGGDTETRTAVQMLYQEAKAKQRYGANYTPSDKTDLIHSLSATSGNRRGTKALETAKSKIGSYVNNRFSTLINANPKARQIYEALKDNPTKLEKALSDFANDMHIAIKRQKEATANQAIPFSSQSYGSTDYDVDISSYLI